MAAAGDWTALWKNERYQSGKYKIRNPQIYGHDNNQGNNCQSCTQSLLAGGPGDFFQFSLDLFQVLFGVLILGLEISLRLCCFFFLFFGHPVSLNELWQARRDSNPQPSDLESDALPIRATGLHYIKLLAFLVRQVFAAERAELFQLQLGGCVLFVFAGSIIPSLAPAA